MRSNKLLAALGIGILLSGLLFFAISDELFPPNSSGQITAMNQLPERLKIGNRITAFPIKATAKWKDANRGPFDRSFTVSGVVDREQLDLWISKNPPETYGYAGVVVKQAGKPTGLRARYIIEEGQTQYTFVFYDDDRFLLNAVLME